MRYKDFYQHLFENINNDDLYLELAKDIEKNAVKLQNMVTIFSSKTGYKEKVYHGSNSKFTIFDTDPESTQRKEGTWNAEYASGTIFLLSDENTARYYGKVIYKLLLKKDGVKKFKIKDDKIAKAMDDHYAFEVFNYPVIQVTNGNQSIYATLDNTLIKLSDVVTYDNNGNVIPLSKRFDSNNNDIRY